MFVTRDQYPNIVKQVSKRYGNSWGIIGSTKFSNMVFAESVMFFNLYTYCVDNVLAYVDVMGLVQVAADNIVDANNRLCGIARVFIPSQNGQSLIEFQFDTSTANPAASCCVVCPVEKQVYGYIQHVRRGGAMGAWEYDNGASHGYTDEGNARATGDNSDPTLANQPTTRPATVDRPGVTPQQWALPKGGLNANYPGNRWTSNPWYPASISPAIATEALGIHLQVKML